MAIAGFQELGQALERARLRKVQGATLEAVAAAYLKFATQSPALYEAMFSLKLNVPFGEPSTPPELRFAFSQVHVLFSGQGMQADSLAELFWAALHGVAGLTRTKRLPTKGQKERLRALIETFGSATAG